MSLIHKFTFYILVISLGFIACRKKDTIAEITVKNGSNQVMPNMKVILVGDINHNPAEDLPLNIADTGTTNAEGVVVFDFTDRLKPGQSGFVNVDIIITNNIDTLIDKMIIKQEEFNSETFYFTP